MSSFKKNEKESNNKKIIGFMKNLERYKLMTQKK
jgi:hypothetical protein